MSFSRSSSLSESIRSNASSMTASNRAREMVAVAVVRVGVGVVVGEEAAALALASAASSTARSIAMSRIEPGPVSVEEPIALWWLSLLLLMLPFFIVVVVACLPSLLASVTLAGGQGRFGQAKRERRRINGKVARICLAGKASTCGYGRDFRLFFRHCPEKVRGRPSARVHTRNPGV